jgi:hypothetical protein
MKFAPIATSAITVISALLNLVVSLPAAAKPVDGVFSIQSRNGYYVDVYGDNFRPQGDNTRVNTHLWNLKDKSNNFELGPDEMSGNEIRVAGQGICITPNASLGSRPADGTLVVATRDCANSWNWKRVGNTWVIGRHMDLCLDIVWGKDQVSNGMQVVTCSAGNPAQQFGTGQQRIVVQPQTEIVPQKNNIQPQNVNNPPTSITQYNTVSQNNRILTGGNTNGGGPSGADRMITCFVFGYYIPLKLVPGFACNQLITNMNARSLLQFPNYLPLSWGQASGICNKIGGKLEWSNNTKMCFKK